MKPCTVIAIDLGGTKIAGGLVRYSAQDEAPQLGARYALPTDPQRGGEAVLATVIEVVLELKRQAGGEKLAGVGIAAAGCIDPKDGSVLYANGIMPGWTGQPLAAAVAQAASLPAAAMGDVHGHALGETRWGGAKGLSSCLFVAAGTGIGGAYALDGKVLRGFHGAAGHIGHVQHPLAAGQPCVCGGSAHVECVTSGTGIGALYQDVPMADPAFDYGLTGAQVSERAQTGDEKAAEALRAAGYALGEACGGWVNILDPEAVVLTGTVVNAGPAWRAAFDEGFAAQALEPLKGTPILPATLGGDAPLIGAAENLLDTLGA